MSKYARIIDIEKLLYRKGFCIGKTPDELYEALSDLPTIDVSEDAISREFALKVIDNYGYNYPTNGDKACAIKNAPSVVPTCQKNRQLEREEGEWIVKANGNNECSICGREKQNGWVNFCGFCGAKMGGAEE